MREMLQALIERLEKAEEGSRQLDSLIAAELGLNGLTAERWAKIVEELPDAVDPDAPRFTESVDAALTLVPKGCNWLVERANNLFWASVVPQDEQANAVKPEDGVYDPSPAKAICIAALKFRAARYG